jgi:hypothetical protein
MKNQLFRSFVALTVFLGLIPISPFVIFGLTGWPKVPYITHQGPLWYSKTYVPYAVLGSCLALLSVLPLLTICTGSVLSFKAKKFSILAPYIVLALIQFIWGYIDLGVSFGLID